ncbi:hypothetical protein LJR034_008972 [Caballeronia sp. LjRoot34]|uniref:hypothetical protein n=1 Tax=Caballeronia sp. LjRoot34 TaxID=3342325 RepID=UPI003ECE302A
MNLSLTLIVTSTLLFYPRVPGVIVFMVGLATSLLINYPSSAKQLAMVKRQSSEALLLAAILFCASVFLGIVTKSAMIDHPTDAMKSIMSMEIGRYLYLLLGVIATPLGMSSRSDSYYFGILPVTIKNPSPYGIRPESVARVMMIAENVGFAISPMIGSYYLAAGLAEVDFGKHMRHAYLRTRFVALVVLGASVACGAIQV